MSSYAYTDGMFVSPEELPDDQDDPIIPTHPNPLTSRPPLSRSEPPRSPRAVSRRVSGSLPSLQSPRPPDLWLKPQAGQRDSLPLLSKVLENHAWNDGRLSCGVASMRGFRPQMEDGGTILRPLTDGSKDQFRFCGVFDGHAQSRKVAATLEELLPRRIGELKRNQWTSKAGLEKACMGIDREILRSDFNDAGSTAIFCIIDKSEPVHSSVGLTLGSVGDSQAMIIHADFSKPPTVPFSSEIHRPHLMDSEIDRIKRAGGFVSNCRVDGELAVSRAFGDAKYKRDISRKMSEQKVIALPSVVEGLSLNVGDILLLACDGLFDSMNSNQIDTFIRGTLISTLVKQKQSTQHTNSVWNVSESLAEVAGKLIDEALLRGSRDNMTVMLVQLVPPSSSAASNSWTDKFSKRYIPPILFADCPGTFLMTVRDELQSLCLDEELTLSQCETVVDARVSTGGFPLGITRSQMSTILSPFLAKQWENRDSWVRLGDFEIPDPKFTRSVTPTRRPADRPRRKESFFKEMMLRMKLICYSTKERDRDEKKKASRRLSSSLGAFGTISSVHISGIEGSATGTFFLVSNIEGTEPLQSRQTSCHEEDGEEDDS